MKRKHSSSYHVLYKDKYAQFFSQCMQTTHIMLCVTAQQVSEVHFIQNIQTLNLADPVFYDYIS